MTTFSELLSNDQFKGLKPLNKNADLERKIDSVDISDTPDIKDFTSPNTFLLTTGMLYQEDQKQLAELIYQLNDVPIAGLGIKVSRFLKKIDQEVLDAADATGMPIIEIPTYWKLGTITHHIASLLSADETGKLYYALDLQQQMNSMLIKEYTIESMVDQMAKLLNVPVMLINPFNEVAAESVSYRTKPELKKAAMNYFTDDYLKNEDKEKFNNEEHVVFEVPAFTYFPYYIVISNVQKMSYPFSFLAIEQAVNTLSFAIYKNSRIKIAEQEETNKFFESLMNSEDNTPINITANPEFFERYNIKSTNFYQVIICGVDREEEMQNTVYLTERYQMTYEWLTRTANIIDPSISIFGMRTHFKFIILLQDEQKDYQTICKYLQKNYKKYFKGSLSFGVGNESTDFKKISMSFIEANEIYDAYNAKKIKEFLQLYKSKSFKELIQLIPVEKLRPYVKSTLGELAYPTQTKDKELKKTLKIYMDNQCDFTKTANLMYVHRNTVKYRITKCEELLGVDITTPKNSLDIRLAIFISENITI